MKKIIGFASFLFLVLLAVLPANASFAATTNASQVNVSSISFIAKDTPANNIVATGSNNNFVLNLTGIPGDFQLSELQVKSATAKTLSIFKKSDKRYSDNTDIQFSGGIASINEPKLTAWIGRISGVQIPGDLLTGYLMTVQDLRDFAGVIDSRTVSQISSVDLNQMAASGVKSPYHIVLYAADASGNESAVNLTIVTDGWKYANGKWYDYTEQGAKITGWVYYGGQWYFLDKTPGKNYGVMVTNAWVKDGAKWYYLNANGTMKTGWFYYGNKWYYLAKSGAMATNSWVYDAGKWYYMDANGVMKTGWVLVGKKWYFLYNDGHMAANTKIGSYRLGRDGAWIH